MDSTGSNMPAGQRVRLSRPLDGGFHEYICTASSGTGSKQGSITHPSVGEATAVGAAAVRL